MQEIDIEQTHEPKTSDRLRQIASGITPGKGISITEVANDIGVTENSVRTHAKKLDCYCVLNIKGKSMAFITHLPE